MPERAHEEEVRAIAEERASLAAQRVHYPLSAARGALYAATLAALLTIGGFVLTDDPWLGAQAALVCPQLCDDCSAPYDVDHGDRPGGATSTPISCSRPVQMGATMQEMMTEMLRPSVGPSLVEVLGLGAFGWFALLALFTIPITIAVDVRELRERRRDRERDLDDREAALPRPR